MGLTIQVGAADQVLEEDFAKVLVAVLAASFPGAGAEPREEDTWYSPELGWSGWGALQERVERVLGAGAAPHFLSMEAWFGAYLPVATEPGVLQVGDDETPFSIAALSALTEELERFGRAANLPTDREGLTRLADKYEDDDLCDDDMDLQTYAQVLLGALVARERRQPLWIIK
jgi:hypothetical protein